MAKKVLTLIKLQIPGGQANPAPPVGPALGQHGVNIMEFCKAFNAQTADQNGRITPVEITVFEDRSFTFITKTPPAAVLIKEALRLEKGSGEPNRIKVGRLSRAQVRQIAETKLARPERARRRPGGADHRRHGPLDGRGGGPVMATHGKRYRVRARGVRPREGRTRRSRPSACSSRRSARSSTRRSSCTSGSASTSATPTSSCAGTLMLPHGTGKEVRIAVFAEGDKAREAEEAGADVVGSADLAKRIEEGFTDFDVAIATPDQMGNVGKLGRILGPRGLMPNPKTGTVTLDVGKAVSEAKAGKLEYRTDRGANVHVVDRQEELRRAGARRELRGRARRDRPREAVGLEGPLHPADHAHEHDGPRHPRRSGADARHRRGVGRATAGGSYSSGLATDPPKTAGSPPCEGRRPAEVR